MDKIETHDIQGLITKGYSNLHACKFLLLAIKDNVKAKQWLKKLAAAITHSSAEHATSALNIAFTFQGLKAIGLPAASLDTFPLELEDGMTTAHKQLFLGDFGNSAPANWEWGGMQNEPVHVLLMIYALSDDILAGLYSKHKEDLENNGLYEIRQLATAVLTKRKEHFGFHDGIAQPTIDGLNRKDVPENTVATGEFVLGYKNSYDQYPVTPMVAETTGDSKILPVSSEAGMRDLGKNGSYLVFRQMAQDVELFWHYIEKATTKNEVCDSDKMIKLAAKMVGRWPSGTPIVLSPEKDVETLDDKNIFTYRGPDGSGLKCPIGSHIRRANPRDSLDTTREASVQVSNKHRILRRGRSYGKPVCESLKPEDILNSKNFEGERGLYFICVNADISRQFEFIQNAWVNSPKFLEFYDERDPVIGNNLHPQDPHNTGIFSTPESVLRTRYTDVPQFTTIKGGAYFFMPGLKALSYLSTI